MREFERAFALMDRISERTAERLEPTPCGPVVVHTRLNRVHDLNFLRAEQPGDASAEELAAERVQGPAGIGHRRVNVRSEKQRARLEPEFVRLGWEPQHFVLMVQRRKPDRPAEHEVREVDEPTLRPLWAEAIRNEPHGKDETLVEQILEHRRDVGEAVPTRFFATEADGRLFAHAELYSKDGIGQVENVVTLPDYRWRERWCYTPPPSHKRPATTSRSWSGAPTTGRSGCTRGSASRLRGGMRGSLKRRIGSYEGPARS